MPDLRWAAGEHGCVDLRDAEGALLGWTLAWPGFVRGYVIRQPDLLTPHKGRAHLADHPTESTARDWVEDQVRAMGGEHAGRAPVEREGRDTEGEGDASADRRMQERTDAGR